MQSYAGEYGAEYTAHNSLDALPSGIRSLLRGFTGLFGASPEDLQGRLVVSGDTPTEIAEAVENPLGNLTVFVLTTLFSCLIFIFLWIVFKLLIRLAMKVFRIPVIRQADMALGGFLGLLEGIVFVFFIANVLYLAISCSNPSLVDNTAVFGDLFNALLIFN